jgi:DUF1009 family protein
VQSKLGILAGGGELPRLLIESCRGRGRPFHVIAIQGQADAALLGDDADEWLRLGAVGSSFRSLRTAEVDEVVFAGKVARPTLSELRPDWRAARFLARIGGRLLSDNSLLEAILGEFEREGFRVVGPGDVLPTLLARGGAYGKVAPTAGEVETAMFGLAAARRHGLADRGQAAVVQEGEILGLEGPEGTDGLIERCRARQIGRRGAILVKARKPQQQMRADPPVIGLRTMERAAGAGFSGIAVEAGAVLVLDPSAMAAAADSAGMFLIGIEAP